MLPIPIAYRLMAAVALAAAVFGGGYARGSHVARLACDAARAEALDAAIRIKDEAEARGDVLAASLAKKQRELNELRTEYLDYANAITGNCPADLGVLVSASATPSGVSKPPVHVTDSAQTIAASLVAANVAENYGRANECIQQLNHLIDWHEGQVK